MQQPIPTRMEAVSESAIARPASGVRTLSKVATTSAVAALGAITLADAT